MRREIDVVVDAGISSQAHAYAEYRLFAALSHLTGAEGVEHALADRGELGVRQGGKVNGRA